MEQRGNEHCFNPNALNYYNNKNSSKLEKKEWKEKADKLGLDLNSAGYK